MIILNLMSNIFEYNQFQTAKDQTILHNSYHMIYITSKNVIYIYMLYYNVILQCYIT